MGIKAHFLKDNNGNKFYPYAHANAVFDSNGQKVEKRLNDLDTNKIDKQDGKSLSSNDYTDEEKNKLASIQSNAEQNVQSDWNEIDSTSDAYIKNKPTLLPANGGNADTVDNYHSSDLWRSDGATWNPNVNISLGAKANGDEWSFDISRNGKTGCYWHVWDSTHGSLLKVNADDGKVSAPKGFVGNLSGKADTAGTADSAAKATTAITATTATTAYKIRIGNSNPTDGDIWIQ